MAAATRPSSLIFSSTEVYAPIGYATSAPRSALPVPESGVSLSIGRRVFILLGNNLV